MKMRVQRRWMKWVLEEADALEVTFPWERGAKRGLWHRHLSDSKIQPLARRA